MLSSDDGSSEDDIWAYKANKSKSSDGKSTQRLTEDASSAHNIAHTKSRGQPISKHLKHQDDSKSLVSTSQINSKLNTSGKGIRTVTRARTKNETKHFLPSQAVSSGQQNHLLIDKTRENQFSSSTQTGSKKPSIANPTRLSSTQPANLFSKSKSASRRSKTPKKSEKAKCTSCCTSKLSRQKPDGFCPFCQVPFSVLSVETPQWHISDCQDFTFTGLPECPQGSNCTNTILSHFRKYKHTELARRRAEPGILQNGNLTSGGHESPRHELEVNMSTDLRKETVAGNPSTETSASDPVLDRITEVQKTRLSLFSDEPDTISTDEVIKCEVFHIFNKMKSDSQCDSDTQESVSDIFAEDDYDMPSAQQVLLPHVPKNIGESYLQLDDGAEVKLQSPVDGPGNSSDSSDSVVCTGTSSVKENCLHLSPSSPKLTPPTPVINSPNAKAKADFLKLLTPSKTTPSKTKTPRKRALTVQNASQKSTPQRSQSSASAKKAKTIVKEEQETEISGTGKMKNKQSSMLSFLQTKKKKVPTDIKSELVENMNSEKSGSNVICSVTVQSISSESSSDKTTSDIQTSSGTKWWLKKPQKDTKAAPIVIKDKLETRFESGAESSSTNHSSNLRYGTKPYANKTCPFYKKIPGTPFTVDAFRYGTIPGCLAYFLSHFHYDHYCGLTKNFQHPIYCSRITANLVEKKIRVNTKYMRPLSLNTIHRVEGVEVVLLDANHCPGSVLFLFRLVGGQIILHTGDFRANRAMETMPELSGVTVNTLYLDTTYCDPAYTFPAQCDVVNFAVGIATNFAFQHPNGLILVGSYTIGKERIFQAIAEAINSRICVTREKLNILKCLEDVEMEQRLTLIGEDARVHVVPMKSLNYKDLADYLSKFKGKFDRILGFEPTGWTHSKRTNCLEDIRPKMDRAGITLYGVPYSEHSSYDELKRFVQYLRPSKILPTVNNGNPTSRKKMEKLFSDWLKEVPNGRAVKQSKIGQWTTRSEASSSNS